MPGIFALEILILGQKRTDQFFQAFGIPVPPTVCISIDPFTAFQAVKCHGGFIRNAIPAVEVALLHLLKNEIGLR